MFNFRKKKRSNWFQTRSSQQKHQEHEIVFEIIDSVFKKVFKMIGIATLLTTLVIVIIAALILTIMNWINPLPNFGFLSNYGAAPGSFIDTIISSITALLYVIFIHPILFVLNGMHQIIFFIGSGDFAKRILFGGTDGWLGVPKVVIFIGGLASSLVVLISLFAFTELIVVQKNRLSKLVQILKGFFLVIPVIILIPLFFWIFNIITATIIQVLLINSDNESVNNLGLFIFNASFSDGMHDFAEIPAGWSFPGNENFGWIQCLVAEAFMTYILVQITIFLLWNVFEQLILLGVGSLSAALMVKDGGKAFLNYKNVATNRMLSFTFMFVVYNIFLAGIPIISEVGNFAPAIVRPLFVTIGIIAFGIAILKSPALLSSITGQDIRPLNIGNRYLMTTAGLAFKPRQKEKPVVLQAEKMLVQLHQNKPKNQFNNHSYAQFQQQMKRSAKNG